VLVQRFRLKSKEKKIELGNKNPESFLITYLENNFEIINVTGDGNCFYRAVLVALGGKQEANKTLRDLVCDYVQENANAISDAFPEENIKQFIETQRNSGVWATDLIIYGTYYSVSLSKFLFQAILNL
jgi:OTU-like cysteine protease